MEQIPSLGHQIVKLRTIDIYPITQVEKSSHSTRLNVSDRGTTNTIHLTPRACEYLEVFEDVGWGSSLEVAGVREADRGGERKPHQADIEFWPEIDQFSDEFPSMRGWVMYFGRV